MPDKAKNGLPILKSKEEKEFFDGDPTGLKRYRCLKKYYHKDEKPDKIAGNFKVMPEFVKDAIKRIEGGGGLKSLKEDESQNNGLSDVTKHQKEGGGASSKKGLMGRMKDKIVGENSYEEDQIPSIVPEQENETSASTIDVERNTSNELKEVHSEDIANIDTAQKTLEKSGELLEDQKDIHVEHDFLKSLAKTEQSVESVLPELIIKEFGKGNKSLKRELAKVSSIQKSVQAIGDKFDKNDRTLNEIVKSSSSAYEKIKAQIRTIQELQRTVSQLPSGGEMRKSYESVLKGLKNIEEDISEYLAADIPKRLKSIEQSFDLMQGKLGTIDEIQETLKDKGVSIRQEFPPSKEDEEDIVQLAKYGQKIFDLLTIAARHYARNREDISRSGQEKHAQELRKTRERAINEGISKGRLELVEDLMNKFDLDSLFNRESPMDKILVEFLKSNGLVENEEFLQGKTMEIDEKNRTQFEAKAKFQGSGTFIVKKSCLELGEKIIRKAELELKVAAEAEEEAKKSKSISDTEKAEDSEEGKLVKNESKTDGGLETVSDLEEEGKPGKDALKEQNTFQSVSQDQQLRQNADAEGDNNKE